MKKKDELEGPYEGRKLQSKKRYLLAFMIGTFIFISVFSISFIISYYELRNISRFQENTTYKIFSDKMLYDFFEENMCDRESYRKISEDLGFQGTIISDLEEKIGKTNEQVLFRKKYYSLVLLEHFEFVNNLNKKCGRNISTILFFYSNTKNERKQSEVVGRLLDYAYQKNNNLIIYSFDINLDSDLIKALKKKYNVEVTPTIIINDYKKVEGEENINLEIIEENIFFSDTEIIFL